MSWIVPQSKGPVSVPPSSTARLYEPPLGYDGRNLAQTPYACASADLGGTTRTFHNTDSTAACTSLRLQYGNFYVDPNGAGEVTNANAGPLTIQAVIEYPLNTFTPVFFFGTSTLTLAAYSTIVSDAVEIDIPAGTSFWVRTYTQAASITQAIPSGISAYTQSTAFSGNPDTSASGDNWKQHGGTGANNLLTSGQAWISNNFVYSYGPLNVICGKRVGNKSIAIVGDSILAGRVDIALDQGYGVRACKAAGLSYAMIASAGEQSINFTSTATRNRMMQVDSCGYALVDYGTNDIYAGATLSTLQTTVAAVWARLVARGLLVRQTTILPRTTSSDSWVTAGNQTPANAGFETVRLAFNAWLRTLVPGIGAGVNLAAYVIDVCANYEVNSSNVFTLGGGRIYCGPSNNTAYSGDGVHPNALGHPQITNNTPALAMKNW